MKILTVCSCSCFTLLANLKAGDSCCAKSMISHLQHGGTRVCNLVCLHPRALLKKEKQFTSNKVLKRNCKLKGSCILQSC